VKLLAAVVVALMALAIVPVRPAGASAGQQGPARAPDLRVRAVATQRPGSPPAEGQRLLPVHKGPQAHVSAPPSKSPATFQGQLAAISAGIDKQGLVSPGETPSDSTGSIGPVHYIEMVNVQVGMFDRSLTAVGSPVPLTTFIGASSGAQAGDVQIQWDQQAGRWFYAMLELYSNDDKIAFGWSKGGDLDTLTLLNSDWCNFHIDTLSNLHDYPKLGHDSNFMLIGTNVYANNANFTTAGIWAIPKPAAGVTTCTAPTATLFGSALNPIRHLPPDSSVLFTPVPTNTTDASSTGYIAGIDPAFIGVWHMSPVAVGACVTPPCLVADGEIAISAWTSSGASDFTVPQPGGNPTLDALDGRLTQAVQQSDPAASGAEGVWTQHTTQSASGRTIVTWYEVMPSLCSLGVCGAGAKRQEGVVSSPSLYVFNGAISPTSNGDAAVIHYNTGSLTTFTDVRAQSRGAADPLNAMSGETVLRSSTVADTDFSCVSPFGPPCRWGDYAGASPDPTNCSVVWGTSMVSGNTPANFVTATWVTQNFALSEGRVRSGVSTLQYSLNGNDGQTWQDIDAARLRLVSAPCSDSTALISANADLFTSLAGVNQDLGLFVDVDGVPGTAPVAWKESGGLNGTLSPNAAYVQAALPMAAGHTYTVRLKWKANVSTSGSIFAGAGPIAGSGYSPTRLTLELFPIVPTVSIVSNFITSQQTNTGSDGVTWIPIPGLAPVAIMPSVSSRVVLGGNADLFTDTAGFNQDIGILIRGGAFGVSGQLLAWKESGGFNGTFSPNAAFVQATAAVTGGQTYSAQLVWKTNRPAPSGSSIFAGAGPLPGTSGYSPTSLTAELLPSGANPFEAVSTTQHVLAGSNGATWTDLGVQVAVTSATNTTSLVGANADLFTANAGYNQDIAVFVSDNGGAQKLLVWKESGGFGGTLSPNAAFAETVFSMVGGHAYVFRLKWKTNRNSAAAVKIYAGSGPLSGAYSPTRLLVKIVS
jgi:hypothetical protein